MFTFFAACGLSLSGSVWLADWAAEGGMEPPFFDRCPTRCEHELDGKCRLDHACVCASAAELGFSGR